MAPWVVLEETIHSAADGPGGPLAATMDGPGKWVQLIGPTRCKDTRHKELHTPTDCTLYITLKKCLSYQ